MDARVQTPTPESSIGDLFHRLVEDGRHLLGAEANLYKEMALNRVEQSKLGLAATIAGGLLAYAGFIAGLVGLVIGLAGLIGPVAAGLIVAMVTGLIGGLLIRYGRGKLAALTVPAPPPPGLGVERPIQ